MTSDFFGAAFVYFFGAAFVYFSPSSIYSALCDLKNSVFITHDEMVKGAGGNGGGSAGRER